MKSKIEKLEKFIVAEGLTYNDVIGYCMAKLDEEDLIQKRKAEEARRQKLAETFPADDVRSKALLYDYAFEGGKFSSNKDAYPNCQGVVGWINPDPDAPEGDRVYVILLIPYLELELPYSDEKCFVGTTDKYDGKSNTLKLLEYGKKHGVRFPVAELAFNYCKNGVKKGEAFSPAQEQLKHFIGKAETFMQLLYEVGGGISAYVWSSTEVNEENACTVDINSFCGVERMTKTNPDGVCCILAY